MTTPTLLGRSRPVEALRSEIALAARTNAPVLLVGETGVGKEVAAHLIHQQSALCRRPFVAVNCSGIPETLLVSELFGHARGSFTDAHRDRIGLARQADGGTLFLDELGEMSLAMQAALLRFTETGEIQPIGMDRPAGRVHVRLITATNRDLRACMAAGAFREDLYYRLNVIRIEIPALRDRGEDVLALLAHYLEIAAQAHRVEVPQLTPDAAQLLLAYRWPGNIRELRNLTERLVLRHPSGTITPEALPSEVREGSPVPAPPALVQPGPSVDGSVISATGVTAAKVQRLWERMEAGEDFWTVVYASFKARDLTRAELAALIDRGLEHTHGSYRGLLSVFNLPPTDYKRFHAFLYQQQCNLPIGPYRMLRAGEASARQARRHAARKS
jgi:two-component system NtrC family response regulator